MEKLWMLGLIHSYEFILQDLQVQRIWLEFIQEKFTESNIDKVRNLARVLIFDCNISSSLKQYSQLPLWIMWRIWKTMKLRSKEEGIKSLIQNLMKLQRTARDSLKRLCVHQNLSQRLETSSLIFHLYFLS